MCCTDLGDEETFLGGVGGRGVEVKLILFAKESIAFFYLIRLENKTQVWSPKPKPSTWKVEAGVRVQFQVIISYATCL